MKLGSTDEQPERGGETQMKVRCRLEGRWVAQDIHNQGAATASYGAELRNDDFWTGPQYIKRTHHPQIERMPGACHSSHFHSFDALSALAL